MYLLNTLSIKGIVQNVVIENQNLMYNLFIVLHLLFEIVINKTHKIAQHILPIEFSVQ